MNNLYDTYQWDDFFDRHCNARFIDEMLSNNISFSFESGVDASDYADALLGLDDEYQIKLVDLMQNSGFIITDEYVREVFDALGDSKIILYMICKCQGYISVNTVKDFAEMGIDNEILREAILKCNELEDLDLDTIIEIVQTGAVDDEFAYKLIKESKVKTATYEQVEELMYAINDKDMAYKALYPYISTFPFRERVNLRDEFDIED
jgi:hypothetical protein